MSRHKPYEGGAWSVGETTLHFGPASNRLPALLKWRGEVARLLTFANDRKAVCRPYIGIAAVLEAELSAINARIEQKPAPRTRRKAA